MHLCTLTPVGVFILYAPPILIASVDQAITSSYCFTVCKIHCACVQGYEKANATQDTMYQVRWGADYLMKMIGHGTGTGAGNLEIIYQVPLASDPNCMLQLLSDRHCSRRLLLWSFSHGCASAADQLSNTREPSISRSLLISSGVWESFLCVRPARLGPCGCASIIYFLYHGPPQALWFQGRTPGSRLMVLSYTTSRLAQRPQRLLAC